MEGGREERKKEEEGRRTMYQGGNLVNHDCQPPPPTPPHHVSSTTVPNTTHTHSHSSPLTNASLPLPYTHLLVPQPYLPQVVKVQFGLHILLAIVGNKRYLEEVVAHEVKSFFDFGDRGLWSTSLGGTPMLFSVVVRLCVVWTCGVGGVREGTTNTRHQHTTHQDSERNTHTYLL